jgi:protein O-mannosyl-transferase
MASKKTKQQPKTISRKPSATGRQSGSLRWLAAAIAVFGIVLYLNTLGHGYVLDDFSVIKENFITMRGFEGIPELWSNHSRFGYWNSPGELYRPIPMTMFAIEWQLAPDQPWLGHLVNILLYGLSGAVLFLTLARWMKNYNVLLPLLTTLFFVAHPVHVEVVANIKSRDEMVMFLLCLVSLNLLWKHLESGKMSALLLALLAYTGALFSKENAVTFVAIVPLAMYFFSKSKLPKIAATAAMFIGPAIFFIIVRKLVIGDLVNPGDVSVLDNFLVGAKDTGTFVASAFLMLGKYLWTLIFPYELSSDFGYNQIPLTGWGDWRVLASVAAWLGMGVFALIRLKKKDLWAFAILFFLINFSIFTNLIVTIGTSYGDRLLYSASPGFALALALGLMKIFNENEKATVAVPGGLFQNKALWAVAGGILAFYSFKTIDRNADWKDSYTLYEADIQTSPNAAKLNFHSGLEVVQKGLKETDPATQKALYDLAQQRFEKAISIYPEYHDAYSQLGLIYYRAKNYEKAMENYNLALKYKPNFPLVYSNMGIIFFEQGNLEQAKEVYEKAVQYDPRMKDALRNLGAVNAMQKNFQEAIKWFSQAEKYWPEDATINFYLGSAYRDAGQEEKGRPYLEKAYRLDPSLKK